MITELLAPAKDKETAFAAIDCGADAIYIGASNFGARKNAPNSLTDIREVVNYAHKFWAKVFVTVNTILTDTELEQGVKLIKELDEIGVDAILVQDMGLLKRLIDLNCKIPIHMSTQCDNRDTKKIDFFNKMGITRVVLARELSLKQIKEIHEANPNIELESFVHGALCVSYSGQCYLSQYIGGRSANRGECAQPCRKKYNIITNDAHVIAKNIYPLCLKDFNASEHIKEMIDCGVYSFKIEGRLKDINYVKNIVSFYRQELDKYSQKSSSGISTYSFTPNPEKSFNRGFTDYFLKERNECYNFKSPKSRGEYIGKVIQTNKDYFVIKTNKKINNQDGLCFYNKNDLDGFLVNRAEQHLNNKLLIYPNKCTKLNIGDEIYKNNDVDFEKLLSKPVKRQVRVNIKIADNTISIIDENNINVSFNIPNGESAKNQEKMNETFVKQFSKTGESDFCVNKFEIYSDIPFMPISEINKLRRDIFEKLMTKRLENYKRNAQRKINYTKYYKESVDYRANIHNKDAKKFYELSGCNVTEMSLESEIPKRQIELMRTKHCIKYALGMCKSPEKLFLEDEKGIKYPLIFDCNKCEMAVLTPN